MWNVNYYNAALVYCPFIQHNTVSTYTVRRYAVHFLVLLKKSLPALKINSDVSFSLYCALLKYVFSFFMWKLPTVSATRSDGAVSSTFLSSSLFPPHSICLFYFFRGICVVFNLLGPHVQTGSILLGGKATVLAAGIICTTDQMNSRCCLKPVKGRFIKRRLHITQDLQSQFWAPVTFSRLLRFGVFL